MNTIFFGVKWDGRVEIDRIGIKISLLAYVLLKLWPDEGDFASPLCFVRDDRYFVGIYTLLPILLIDFLNKSFVSWTCSALPST